MTNGLETPLSFPVNEQELKTAVQSLKKVESEYKSTIAAMDKAERANKALAIAHAKLGKESKGAATDIDKSKRAIRDEREEAERAKRSFFELADAKRDAAKRAGSDVFGDTSSSLAGVRGGLDALSGGRLGTAGTGLEVAEGFSDLGEFLPIAKAQLSALGETAATSGGLVGKLSTGLAASVPVLGAAGAGLASIAAVGVPVAVALGAAALAFKNFKDNAKEQADALNSLIENNRGVAQDIASGLTSEEAAAKLEQLKRAREAELSILNDSNVAYQNFVDNSGAATETFAKLFSNQEQALVDQIDKSEAAIDDYANEIRALERALEQGTLSANDAAAVADALRQSEQALTQEREQAQQRLEAINQSIANLDKQRDDLLANRGDSEAKALELEGLERQFAHEDERQEERDHQAALAGIREEGRDNLEKIESEIAALPEKRLESLGDISRKSSAKLREIEADRASALSDLSTDYMDSQLKETRAFRKEMERSEKASFKAIARAARDLENELSSAQRENDVIRFLEAQARGEQSIADQKADADEEAKQRLQDYIDKNKEAAADFQKRQDEIGQRFDEQQSKQLKALDEETAKIKQAFDERRAELIAATETEKAAIEQRLEAAIDAYNRQEDREDQQADRAAQRLEIRDRHEEESFQAQLDKIEATKQAELNRLSEVQQVIAGISTRISDTQANIVRSDQQAAVNPFVDERPTRGIFGALGQAMSQFNAELERRDRRIPALATGGVVLSETIAKIGEVPETVIPLHKLPDVVASLGIPPSFSNRPASGSGVTIVNNMTIAPTVGDIASMGAVRQELTVLAREQQQELGRFIESALSGNVA